MKDKIIVGGLLCTMMLVSIPSAYGFWGLIAKAGSVVSKAPVLAKVATVAKPVTTVSITAKVASSTKTAAEVQSIAQPITEVESAAGSSLRQSVETEGRLTRSRDENRPDFPDIPDIPDSESKEKDTQTTQYNPLISIEQFLDILKISILLLIIILFLMKWRKPNKNTALQIKK